MSEYELHNLISEVLEDSIIKYEHNFADLLYICILLHRHLTDEQIQYIYRNWYAFYHDPTKYSNLKDIINECLDNLENSRKE